MGKNGRKAVFTIIILLLFSATVFYFGWVQFSVPVDKIGVLISKTSGVCPEIIQAGKFVWRWERLLPTNSVIKLFSAEPISRTVTRSGKLPSGDLYASQLGDDCNFSYNISITLCGQIKPDGIISLVKTNHLANQSDLNSYIENKFDIISDSITEFLLENALKDSSTFLSKSLTANEILLGIDAENRFPEIDISSVVILTCNIPDTSLYLLAKNAYLEYQAKNQETILLSSTEISKKAAQDNAILDKMSRLGKILTENPILLDFLKTSNSDMNDILNTIGIQNTAN